MFPPHPKVVKLDKFDLYFLNEYKIKSLFFLGGNAFFVLRFCPDSHFDPYILFLPILDNTIHFSLFSQCHNSKILAADRTIKVIIIDFILALKNARSASKLNNNNLLTLTK